MRRNGVSFVQARISGIVRPQPTHQPVRPSNRQAAMQGSFLRMAPSGLHHGADAPDPVIGHRDRAA